MTCISMQILEANLTKLMNSQATCCGSHGVGKRVSTLLVVIVHGVGKQIEDAPWMESELASQMEKEAGGWRTYGPTCVVQHRSSEREGGNENVKI
jgi:hypothetical protein